MDSDRQTRHIKVVVGVVEHGIGVDCHPWWGLGKEDFKEFLHEMLAAAGFPWPDLVHIERNREDGQKVDWARIRISSDQCQLADVEPAAAVRRLCAFLHDNKVLERRYGLKFLLAPSQVPV